MLASDVLDRAYDDLQDAERVRYAEASLLRYIHDGVTHARSVRPDLFIGSLTTPIAAITSSTQTVPLPDWCTAALAWYVVGRAEVRDDEFAVDGRAASLIGALTQKLVQGV